ncbi:coiled-coil domain-containing protein 169-like [Suncus etruscus]|uniref:coiled-coil domain-containing protein 169-like n=1 Tax=Suncus etruscus TaxID=109475 RepID=UPI00210F2A64|nr:coiled-coil domain-containing protein 169-like [Suncus etruscus]
MTHLEQKLKDEVKRKDSILVSINELKQKVAELEKKGTTNTKESREWRVRYEAQLEINSHLEKQVLYLKEKLDKVRGNYSDRLASIRLYERMSVESLTEILRQLQKDKRILENQVRACGLRLEQESKLNQKTREECRKYAIEISKMTPYKTFKRQQIEYMKRIRENPSTNIGAHSLTNRVKKGSDKKKVGSSHLPKLKP